MKTTMDRAPMFERHRDEYTVTSDRGRMDLDVIHGYLSRAYWCQGIPRRIVEQAMENSLCFALLMGERQIGFARIVSDYTTFAYLCDVFVLESHQGKAL